jgi:hypothetical protein
VKEIVLPGDRLMEHGGINIEKAGSISISGLRYLPQHA